MISVPQKPSRIAAGRRLPPAQWSLFGFRVAPLAVFALGSWAVVYGLWRHRIAVTSTREKAYTVFVPTGPDLSSLVPGMLAPPPPPPKPVQRFKTIRVVSQDGEPAINRDVTVGRLELKDGKIAAKKLPAGPAFCPT